MDRNTFEGKVSNNPPKLVQATGAETGRLGGEIVTRALGDPVLSLVTWENPGFVGGFYEFLVEYLISSILGGNNVWKLLDKILDQVQCTGLGEVGTDDL